ncbi:MAG: zinc ribbon domain-containing protein [Acidobacteria bacterium]|nr:zinc ribbon domain-containing protein [Acidobacteriota bacterium]
MPIYEYVCQKCGHHLEIMQKMSDKPLNKCPECKGKLEKIFSQTSFQLKGSGWYVTDYSSSKKTDKPAKVEKAEKAEKTEKADKTEKTEKKESTGAGASAGVASTTGAADK